MSSKCTNDGQMNLDVTFELGTNLDTAQVLVQNRVAVAEAKLPEEVKRIGVTTKKKSPSILLCVNLVSAKRPDGSFYYDQLYLSNFATLSVKDDLARIKGVGDVAFLGPRDYSMRVWLDPDKLAARDLTANDVINAVREQNRQVAAGRLGQPPVPTEQSVQFQLPINTAGRLTSDEQFENIVLKTSADGGVVHFKDVVRETYRDAEGRHHRQRHRAGREELRRQQLPRRRAIVPRWPCFSCRARTPSTRPRRSGPRWKNSRVEFPGGVDYRIYYDTTVFVEESITSVIHTLIEAFILVFIVVLVFLQNWRATIIPMVAVPVSLIGTFAVMAMLGFSLNNLSLFGLVLAIGIVVDDAIVVVENVERWLAEGLSPRDAAARRWTKSPGR